MKLLKLLTDRPWTLAFLVLLGVVAWFASGLTARRAAGPEATADSAGVAAPLTRVQVRAQTATPVARIVSVYGRTKPARTGSPIAIITIGMVDVADLAARLGGVP